MSIHERINARAKLVAMVKGRRKISLTRDGVVVVLFRPLTSGYSITIGTGYAVLTFGEVVGEAMYTLINNQNIDLRC